MSICEADERAVYVLTKPFDEPRVVVEKPSRFKERVSYKSMAKRSNYK